MSKVGDRIHVLRIKRGLSQAQLADKVNLKRSAIGNYELGLREPDLDTIEALADFFDVSISDLMGREETAADKLHDIGQQLTALSRSDAYKSLKSELSSIKFAFLGEIEDMTDEEIQDMWDYHRFKRAQKAKQEEKP
jgi:transcriptional regulator with XRE-family HTH domain